ncbi:MAG: Xaa-Pro peptidase family protein [Gemmatimonadota bacterium]
MALLVLLACSVAGAQLRGQDTAFAKAEFAARRSRLLQQIPDGIGIVFAGMEDPLIERFRQSPDFYYLTGIEEPGAILLLNGANGNATIFAARPVGSGDSWLGGGNSREHYGITIQPLENFFTFLSFATGSPKVTRIFTQLSPPDDQLHARFESRVVAAGEMDHPLMGRGTVIAQAIDRIHQAQPQLPLADLSGMLDELRWVKTPYEITRLRRAGAIGAAAVAEAIRGTRPGMYEYEIAAAAQFTNRRLGARGDGFPPIVPSGPNATNVHYMLNHRQMLAGEMVYLDYGSDFDYYVSDITRAWPVSGRFSDEQEKMYRCILDVRNAVIAAMKPGVTIDQLRDLAEPVYQKYGYLDAFKGTNGGRYLGHFIGISVHDVIGISGADAKRPFVAGVVFNVEPVLEFPDRGIHIRLEDTILITADGAENLTAGVPAEVDQLLALEKESGVNSRPAPRQVPAR